MMKSLRGQQAQRLRLSRRTRILGCLVPRPLWSGDQYRIKEQNKYELRDVRVGDVFRNEEGTFIVLRLDDDLIPLVFYLHSYDGGSAFGFKHLDFICDEHKTRRLPEVVPGLALLAQSQGYKLEVV